VWKLGYGARRTALARGSEGPCRGIYALEWKLLFLKIDRKVNREAA
jgi:hypothetical protein